MLCFEKGQLNNYSFRFMNLSQLFICMFLFLLPSIFELYRFHRYLAHLHRSGVPVYKALRMGDSKHLSTQMFDLSAILGKTETKKKEK